MKPRNILMIFVLFYALIAILAYSTGLVPENFRGLAENIIYLFAPLLAVICGIYALSKHDVKSLQGKTILLITIGLLLWLIGEAIWLVRESILNIQAFPSIGDFFYLMAYPFVIWGVLNELSLGKITWNAKKIAINLFIGILLFAATFYFGGLFGYDSSVPALENIVSITYGVADLVIILSLILLINLSIEFKGGSLARSWVVFAAGMIFYWVADILIYGQFTEQYDAMQWAFRQLDYLWMAAYLFIAYSFLMQAESIDKIKDNLMARLSMANKAKPSIHKAKKKNN